MVVDKTHILREIDLPEAIIRLRRDGIIHVFYKENVVLDPPLQEAMINLFREMTNNKKSNYIFEADEGFYFSKEARDNSIRLEENSPVFASGIIVKNLASRLIANFFIKVTGPKIKYRLFGTVEEAVKWLNTVEITQD